MTGNICKIFRRILGAIILFGVVLALSLTSFADSLLVTSVAHAYEIPDIDASSVPDFGYGKTEAMYVRNPLVDDSGFSDLSDMSGSFYALWREGRLYFHFVFRNFSLNDGFTLYFDLDDDEDGVYGENRTVSVTFTYTEDGLSVTDVENVSEEGDTEAFLSSVEAAFSVVGSRDFCGEVSLDFGALYEGFVFSANYRIGFDVEAFDVVDAIMVRYCWNDDSGAFTESPRTLGTLVMSAPLYVDDVDPTPLPEDDTESEPLPDEDDKEDDEDTNPGTSDGSAMACGVLCLCSLIVGVSVSCHIKI